jgi:hypothetical protein
VGGAPASGGHEWLVVEPFRERRGWGGVGVSARRRIDGDLGGGRGRAGEERQRVGKGGAAMGDGGTGWR